MWKATAFRNLAGREPQRRLNGCASIIALAAVLVAAMMMAACSGTLRLGTITAPRPTSGGVVSLWPTVDALTGDLPIGRWACFYDSDLETIRKSNSAQAPGRCYVSWMKVVEFHYELHHYQRDGYPPDTAFAVDGSPLLYSRSDEYRWGIDDQRLHIQTTGNDYFQVEMIADNVLAVTDHRHATDWLIRVGSAEHRRMLAFRQCVTRNYGRKLFEVEECEVPFYRYESATHSR